MLHFDKSFPEHLIPLCEEIFEAYETLHEYKIRLKQRKIPGSTMQAIPVINKSSFLYGIKEYRLNVAKYVRNSHALKVTELDEEVLKGWFAHEYGHLVDYESRSLVNMLIYGLRYVSSTQFAKTVEHRADRIAIRHGFYKEVRATKRFLLEHEGIHEKYRKKLAKRYMSIEELQTCHQDWINNPAAFLDL